MDYGEDEALHFGAEYYPERQDCDTEFHLICARQRSGEEDRPVKKLTAEARFVAEPDPDRCWTRGILSPARMGRCVPAGRRTL